jgi:hypothetical protein
MFVMSCLCLAATIARPTSCSDTHSYNSFCQNASENSEIFSNFRTNEVYRGILEHVSMEQGRDYLNVILQQDPEILTHLQAFKKNDSLGNPLLYSYDKTGMISPTTLRYIKVASNLMQLFGSSLDGGSIIEIGGGYGGQCRILSELVKYKNYTIVDLPGPLALTKKYLETLNVPNVTFKTFDEDLNEDFYDLVISNYAYTECTQEMQEKYDREILSRSKNGYFTCADQGSSKPDFLGRIQKFGIQYEIMDENPKTGASNYCLIWKDKW